MIGKRFSMVAVVGILTLAPLAAEAQVTPPPGGRRQRLELERRLQLGFQRTVQSQLGLQEGEVVRLREVMRAFQEERAELNRAQASLRHRLRDPAIQDMEEPTAQALLRELVDVQERELALYRREQEQLLQFMTPVQVLRFYRLRDNLGQRIQQLRQGRGGGRGPGGISLLPIPEEPPVGGGVLR
jgi:hypothetical protein